MEPYEISIMKGMLRMGFSPALVQSYFTRPDRLVNPARIQEVKTDATARIASIVAATDEEVGAFVDEFDRQNQRPGGYAPPLQEATVTRFELNNEGRVSLVSSDEEVHFGKPEIQELYEELRIKAVELYGIGHNSLGTLAGDISKFIDALPENSLEASPVRIFMRGSGLKSKVASYQASQENPELYPVVQIDRAIVPLVTDLLAAFSLLVNITPAMAELEAKAGTEQQYVEQGQALEAIQPALQEVEEVADPEAAQTLKEQAADGIAALEDRAGRGQRAVAFSSVRNFAISVFTPVYRATRYILGDNKLPSLVQAIRNSVAGEAAKRVFSYLYERSPLLVDYIRHNAESLIVYADRIISDPQLQELVRLLLSFFS